MASEATKMLIVLWKIFKKYQNLSKIRQNMKKIDFSFLVPHFSPRNEKLKKTENENFFFFNFSFLGEKWGTRNEKSIFSIFYLISAKFQTNFDIFDDFSKYNDDNTSFLRLSRPWISWCKKIGKLGRIFDLE